MTAVSGAGPWLNAPGVSTPPTATLKAPMAGIGPRTASPLGRPDDVGGVVCDMTWAALQPSPDGPIVTNGTGPGTWAQITTARSNGTPYRVRIHAGDAAPTWVKNLAGGPLFLVITERKPGDNTPPGTTGYTAPYFWTAAVLNAWGDLMRLVAALLESDPLCLEVASHPSTLQYAEPFMRHTTSGVYSVNAIPGHPNYGKSNVQVLYDSMRASGVSAADAQVAVNAAGTAAVGPSAADAASLIWPMEEVTVGSQRMSRWQSFGFDSTRYYLAINPLQQWWGPNPPGNNQPYSGVSDPGDWSSTTGLGGMVAAMGPRIVLGNNSIRLPLAVTGPKYAALYVAMHNYRNNVTGFQTATQDILNARYRAFVGDQSVSPSVVLRQVIDVAMGIVTAANDNPTGLVSAPVTDLRAAFVELPPGWDANITPAQAAVWNARGRQNAANL